MLKNVEHTPPGPRRLSKQDGVGVVVIGRNEGERLQRCLASIGPHAGMIVYVDSGSTDGSVQTALHYGAEVVELDMSTPFCAARARNAGYQRLVESDSQVDFVQFIDGDCELTGDWLPRATDALRTRPEHAVVAGRLREKFPELSIYNRLGDFEWNASGAGEVDSVGGIFMIRRDAFEEVGGFDPTVAAGEEPELCQRLVRRGWRLVKLDQDMARHDLAMTRFGQWWRRMVRSGYGSMDVGARFDVARFTRNNWRVRIWMVWLALIALLAPVAGTLGGAGLVASLLVLLGIWPAQLVRIAVRTWRKGQPLGMSVAYAVFIMISFFPQAVGQLMYFADRSRNRSFRLVEYKAPASPNNKLKG